MRPLRLPPLLLLCVDLAVGLAPQGRWDNFNFAPKSKTVYPAAIHSSEGSLQNAQQLVENKGSAILTGQGSWVALDYGMEVRLSFHSQSVLALFNDRSAD